MSQKRTVIGVDRLRELEQSHEQLRAIRRDLPEHIDRTMRQVSQDVQSRLEPLERRQREYGQALNNVRREVREVEQRTSRRIEANHREMRERLRETHQRMARQRVEMAESLARSEAALRREIAQSETALRHEIAQSEATLRREIKQSERRLRQETRQLIAEQENRLTSLVEEERRTRQEQVRGLQSQLDLIGAEAERKVELAESWIDTAETIRHFIEGNYRHEQFAPGRLETLGREIDRARQNVAQGVPETALGDAQGAYQQLSDLRLELERLEREWHIWRSAALERAREVLAEARRNRTFQPVDLSGDLIRDAEEQEADWWTGGKLSALEVEVQAVLSQVENEESELSTEALRDLAEDRLPALRQRLGEIVEEARLAIVGSQMRISIADLVVQVLEEQGYWLEDGTYAAEDYREGYVAKTRFRDGAEVVVTVSTDEGDVAQNVLDLNYYNVEHLTEHELLERAGEVARSLRGRGLEASEPSMVARDPDPRLRDMERIKKETLAQVTG
jgi:hypothetical protein